MDNMQTPEDANGIEADGIEAAGTAASDEAAIDAMLDELGESEAGVIAELDEAAAARAQAAEMRDKLLRLQAEWDNYRKRTEAERSAERTRAAARLVERLLPVLDDLSRAIEHSENASAASLAEGIQAVLAKLGDILGKEGVTEIDPVGEAFDANLHRAMGTVEDATVYDETVTEVYQKGYTMGGRILRPALVAVSSGGARREAAQPDAASAGPGEAGAKSEPADG
jgi:molecular chaperone GrpE